MLVENTRKSCLKDDYYYNSKLLLASIYNASWKELLRYLKFLPMKIYLTEHNSFSWQKIQKEKSWQQCLKHTLIDKNYKIIALINYSAIQADNFNHPGRPNPGKKDPPSRRQQHKLS